MKYYSVGYGTFPIIIVSSHGGTESISKKRMLPGSITINDLHTKEIAENISNIIYNETGLKPYFIGNNIHRRYLDLNRRESVGAETEITKQNWNNFHNELTSMVIQCQNKFGHCLLCDIHGNTTTNMIQFGYGLSLQDIDNRTFEQSSFKYLSKFYLQKELIIGDRSISQFIPENITSLPSMRYNTIPKIRSKILDGKYFNGGFITRHYSSTHNIDAIQIEISRDIRNKDNIYNVATITARSIIRFYFINYYQILSKNVQV